MVFVVKNVEIVRKKKRINALSQVYGAQITRLMCWPYCSAQIDKNLKEFKKESKIENLHKKINGQSLKTKELRGKIRPSKSLTLSRVECP